MRFSIVILSLVLASLAHADGSLASGQQKYTWKTLSASTTVNPTSSSTIATPYVAFPMENRVLQLTVSSTPTAPIMSVIVVGSADGSHYATTATASKVITADGTYLIEVGSPQKDVPHSKVILQQSNSVTSTVTGIIMGSN